MISRFLTSKGHGVHSPFAFSFITGVLGERCEYYDLELLRHFATTRRLMRMKELLYRLILHFRPGKVVCLGDGASHWGKAAELAIEALDGDVTTCVMYVVGGSDRLEELERREPEEFVVVWDMKEQSAEFSSYICGILDRKGYGMTFNSSRGVEIAVALPWLPRQDYRLIF